jgi:ABC-type transport system substrate-binding protein
VSRRARIAAALLCAVLATTAQAQGGAAAPAPKVFRYSFPAAETGFDPARINDLYSRYVTAHIFDGLYKFDPLARPFLVRPNVADGMPQHSDDYRSWTVRLKPGIHFADDPVFKGAKRELVAQDIVYSYKRIFDPENKSPVYSGLAEQGMLGLDALREQALKTGRFDYDSEVEGLRALDRYTVQFRLKEPRPRFIYTLAAGDLFGAVAREVIEAHPGKTMEHPVGTGPFRLAQWRRSSQIVLERNPNFRELLYDAQPAADDAEGQAILARFKGRRLPMIDRVEISIIEVQQPRWLAFLNEQFDLLALPSEFITLAAPNGKLAPNLARRGIGLHRVLNPDRTLFYFNMDDPLVGGSTPEKVALRRAISLATNTEREIVTVWRGQAIPAQSVVAPGTWGYDPAYKTENSDYDLARAKALLDLYGYLDRDGDGWREQPDGAPLQLHHASTPDESSRPFDELWKKNMDALGLRLVIDKAQWPEQLKKARAGQLMMWQLGYSAANPDVQDGLGILYGPAAGGQNLPRFRNPRFDEIYRQMDGLPDGPQRLALLRETQAIVTALVPMKYKVHRIVTDLTHPWVLGFRRPLYGSQFWQYIDIDTARQPPLR